MRNMEAQPVGSTEAGDNLPPIVEVIKGTASAVIEDIQALFAGFIETSDDEQDEPRFI
jgi:hypothetical protein